MAPSLGLFPELSRTRRLQGEPSLTPFLKWPGGKSQEIPLIAALSPDLEGRLIDPFVGGGSVLFATPAEVPADVNDACRDLIGLYRAAADGDPAFRVAVTALAAAWDGLSERAALFDELGELYSRGGAQAADTWYLGHRLDLERLTAPAGSDLVDLFLAKVARDVPDKFERMRKVEHKVGRQLSRKDLLANVEGAVRSALYMSVRARYNRARLTERWDAVRLADFMFLREYTYAAMFRFNARNEFNVPYGGITYNRKSLQGKVDLLYVPTMQARLANTRLACSDFIPFIEDVAPTAADFVFVDPPYDSDFSDYDNMPFHGKDQERLRAVLESLPSAVMVVIKDTPGIRRLYHSDRWCILERAKTYMWTIKSRNDRETTHLTITNYDPVAQP
jgi:DNA adenine methylase